MGRRQTNTFVANAWIAREVARILLKTSGITVNTQNPFVFQSGIRSPIYCDCRKIMSFPRERQQITSFLTKTVIESIDKDQIDVIAGTATAGIPFAAWLSHKLKLPMVYVREAAKSHGTQRRIEGVIKTGQRALVVEDLISTASSAASSAEEIRAQGGRVHDCLAIMTYEMAAARMTLKQHSIRLFALCDVSTLIEVLAESAWISLRDEASIRQWVKQVSQEL